METAPKCPSCGGDVRAFTLRCPLCGHEFTAVQAPSSMRDLVSQLAAVGSGRYADAMRADLIRNWPIPVSTGDLLEFITFAGSNAIVGVGRASPTSEAWRAKAREAIAKGRIAFREGDAGLDAIRDLEQRLASDNKMRMAVGATRGATKTVLIVFGIIAVLFVALLVFAAVF